jgi:hypothetical protein
MSTDWLAGGDRHELAAERIYAAAANLIARRGLDRFDLDSLAQAAHCSRATLYRHAGGALVFGAGTVQWSWGLDATHDRAGDRPNQFGACNAARCITRAP